ncbi:MAG: D-glycero-beta-D-manno-heptose 1-phosphate adenylyltransferase [Flavobacteriaceae bacterium]|nr:D-glycero-beta-D-manno-heptose 1-phosphate adenylyltransferase [Flavobacteriaceae bacterium]
MTHLEKIQSKIYKDSFQCKSLLENWRENKEQIVFSNGCFDILHQGHIVYLAKAAQLGTKLVIGLNTDASIKRIKGENRPINNEHERALLLSALGFVNLVVFFEEDTPYKLIKTVQPNILVKGADYKAEEIVGYDIVTENGGKVETVVLEEGFSTTGVIEKIKNLVD